MIFSITPVLEAPGYQGNPHDPPSDLFHDFPADDPGLGPIGPFHQDIGLQGFDQAERVWFIEWDHVIHELQRGQNLSSLLLRHNGPSFPL